MAGRQKIDDVNFYKSTEYRREYLINKSGMKALGVEFDPDKDFEDSYLLDQDLDLDSKYDDINLDDYKEELEEIDCLDDSNY